jgi:hypothetical protein
MGDIVRQAITLPEEAKAAFNLNYCHPDSLLPLLNLELILWVVLNLK